MSIEAMAKKGYAVKLPTNTVIFHENDLGAEMYIVLQGSVDIILDPAGKKIKVAEIGQGGFFGEMSLLENQRRTATAVTNADTVLLVVTKNNFDEVIAGNPQIAIRIMKGLSGRIRELNNRLKDTTASQVAESAPPTPKMASATPASAAPGIEDNPAARDSAAAGQPVQPADDYGPEVKTEQHNEFLLHKDFACPICNTTFPIKVVKESKLKQVKRTEELRVLYENVDPLLYNVLICPVCYSAMKREDFEKLDELSKKKLSATTDDRRAKFNPDFGRFRTLGFIIDTYRIAINCYETLKKSSLEGRVAGLWLNLAWLYEDAGKTAKASGAKEMALTFFKSAYLTGTGGSEQDHKMEYLIGKLCHDKGYQKDAREYFFKAASRRDGHTLLKQMARDYLEIIKQSE